MKKLFIVNSRAEPKVLARFKVAVAEYSAKYPDETEIVYTEFAGHAGEAARNAAGGEDLLIVACGGDGTMHEVANSLARTDTPPSPS